MRVRVWVEGDPGDELRSLHGWLLDEPAVRHAGAPTIEAQSRPGAMGTLDVLALVIGSGLTAAQLLTSVAGWRVTRPQKYLVRVQSNGRTVEVRTEDPQQLRKLADELEAAIAEEQDQPQPASAPKPKEPEAG